MKARFSNDRFGIKRAQRIWMRILIPAITVSTPGLVYYFLYPESTLGFVMALTYAFIWNDIFLSLFDPRFKDRKYREKLVSILIAMALVAAVLVIVFVDWEA